MPFTSRFWRLKQTNNIFNEAPSPHIRFFILLRQKFVLIRNRLVHSKFLRRSNVLLTPALLCHKVTAQDTLTVSLSHKRACISNIKIQSIREESRRSYYQVWNAWRARGPTWRTAPVVRGCSAPVGLTVRIYLIKNISITNCSMEGSGIIPVGWPEIA